MMKVALAFTALTAISLCGTAAKAQEVTGELGAPSATTTVPGNHLPAAPPEFGGVIKETIEGSKTWWPSRIVPPKGYFAGCCPAIDR